MVAFLTCLCLLIPVAGAIFAAVLARRLEPKFLQALVPVLTFILGGILAAALIAIGVGGCLGPRG